MLRRDAVLAPGHELRSRFTSGVLPASARTLSGSMTAGEHGRSLDVSVGFTRAARAADGAPDRNSTRLNSSHEWSSYAVFCLKKKMTTQGSLRRIRDWPYLYQAQTTQAC